MYTCTLHKHHVTCHAHHIELAVMALLSVLLYLGGSLLLLMIVLWLSATAYLYIVRRKYAHIPSPKMSRYQFFLSLNDTECGPALHVQERKGLVSCLHATELYCYRQECSPIRSVVCQATSIYVAAAFNRMGVAIPCCQADR